VIYVLSSIKIGSGIQELMRGDTQTHRRPGDLISLLAFFQNEDSRLKINKQRACVSQSLLSKSLPTHDHVPISPEDNLFS
jgi:hypothetical protein